MALHPSRSRSPLLLVVITLTSVAACSYANHGNGQRGAMTLFVPGVRPSPLSTQSPFTPCRDGHLHPRQSSTVIRAISIVDWFRSKKNKRSEHQRRLQQPSQILDALPIAPPQPGNDTGSNFVVASVPPKQLARMQSTARMMEDHRRSQEAAERTAAMMDELSNVQVVGKSSSSFRSGVKATFDGRQRPLSVEVDANFMFRGNKKRRGGDGGEEEAAMGLVSIEELNEAVTDAVLDGWTKSGVVMKDRMKGLYEQLGLPQESEGLED